MNTQPSHYRLYRDTISVQPGIEIAGSSSHPKECVVLSDDERKTLREVERQLMLEDPEFAQSFPAHQQHSPRNHHRPTDKIAIVVAVLLSALLSALLLIAGLLSGVLTFAAVAGLIWAAWRYSDRISRRAT
jgi:DUF3040 family protein